VVDYASVRSAWPSDEHVIVLSKRINLGERVHESRIVTVGAQLISTVLLDTDYGWLEVVAKG